MDFTTTAVNVLITVMYVLPGYILCKCHKATASHLSTLSAVLVYIGAPCMTITSFFPLEFSTDFLLKMLWFAIVTFITQSAFMLILYAIFRHKYKDAKYRIFTIGSVMGNVGFFGLPVVKALVPGSPEVMCYSCVYVLTMNILVFTVGAFCLTEKKEFMTIKAGILNPTFIAFTIGIIIYIFRLNTYIPTVLADSLTLVGRMTTPLCMIILGIRIATVPLKKVFLQPFVYLICFSKLVIYPLFCYGLVYFLPFDYAFKAAILILSATPCAAIILNLAEMYRTETEISANCVTVSTLMCLITIPVITLIL